MSRLNKEDIIHVMTRETALTQDSPNTRRTLVESVYNLLCDSYKNTGISFESLRIDAR